MDPNKYRHKPWIELQALLDRDGMTQRQLARESGLSPQYVNDIIRGRAMPSPRARKAFAEVLRVPLTTLLPPGDQNSRYAELIDEMQQLPERDERPPLKN